MQKITPFLWLDGQAEAAMTFYTTVFKNAEAKGIHRMPDGKVLTTSFSLMGMDFVALNGGPQFKFNESVSFVINCENQEEIDYYWENLIADGGAESMCGWLKDRFGLSWQVVPKDIGRLMTGGEPVQSARVYDALMQMRKIDIAALEKAFEG